MISIDSTTAKSLVMKSGYKMVYSDRVKSNGGNSAKISCKKEFIDKEAVIFILDKSREREE
jgi:putative transposon-encoded protein